MRQQVCPDYKDPCTWFIDASQANQLSINLQADHPTPKLLNQFFQLHTNSFLFTLTFARLPVDDLALTHVVLL